MTSDRKWFSLLQQSDGKATDIYVYDEIGAYGQTAKDFVMAVSCVPNGEEIRLHVNSPGGSVFDALAIYNFLNRRPEKITCTIDGLAASAATIVPLCADKVIMPRNAMMFLHNPWTVCAGNASDLMSEAAALQKMEQSIVSIYAAESGQSPEKVAEMLDDETWLSADEALALGLCDEVVEPAAMTMKYDPSAYAHVRDRFAKKELPAMTIETAQASAETTVVEQHATSTTTTTTDSVVTVTETAEPAGEATCKCCAKCPDCECENCTATEPEAEPQPEPAAATSTDARAEFKAFVTEFGDERAAKYFAAGHDMAAASKAYAAELRAEVADLRGRLAASPTVAAAAFAPAGDGTPDLWAQYKAITDPYARRAFWVRNQAALSR